MCKQKNFIYHILSWSFSRLPHKKKSSRADIRSREGEDRRFVTSTRLTTNFCVYYVWQSEKKKKESPREKKIEFQRSQMKNEEKNRRLVHGRVVPRRPCLFDCCWHKKIHPTRPKVYKNKSPSVFLLNFRQNSSRCLISRRNPFFNGTVCLVSPDCRSRLNSTLLSVKSMFLKNSSAFEKSCCCCCCCCR